MASIAEMQDALINADRAGDKEAARQIADAIFAAQRVESAKPASARAGGGLMDVGRQIGLTARYGLEGLANVGDLVHEPIRALVNIGSGDKPRAGKSLTNMATSLADTIGLPSPEGADERVVGDATRMVAGSAGLAGLAGRSAQAATGATRNVLSSLAANPGKQSLAAATGGLSGGAVREAGGDPLAQGVASFAGGIVGGLGADVAQRGAGMARAALTPARVQLENADQQIRLVLQRQGIDWGQVPERVRQSMREEAARAMSSGGELNGDALRRLVIMQRAGIRTPTVGQLTQDPGQLTREQNLAKVAANSTDQALQRLPRLQNENVNRLLGNLDDLGAQRGMSPYDAGGAVTNRLGNVINERRGEINALYSSARDSQGRSVPLDGHTFTNRASELLDQAMVGGSLPPGVQSTLNKIALGEIPLNVEIAEQIKTQIGKLQRNSSDGNVRMALGLVRQALDDAPLRQAAPNGGNMLALPGAQGADIGQEAINAFNLARSANRQFMGRVESSPALRAVMDGAEPDEFVNRYIISKTASAGDVQMLRSDLDPQTTQVVKDYLVKHLRDAATSSTDDISKFSNASYRKALRDIGDQKLSAFFSPEEIQLLKDTGNAAKYLQAQPAGSAVNNSNSGALVLGRGMDMLDSFSQKLPLGLRDVLSGTIQGQQQRQVLAPRNALRVEQPGARTVPANALLLGLVPPVAQSREDDERKKRP